MTKGNCRIGSTSRTGKSISTYVAFDAAEELRELAEGEVLELVTDDLDFLERDIATWAEVSGHRIVESVPESGRRRYLIEKGPSPGTERSLAMVISVDGLEELLSPLAFALAAGLCKQPAFPDIVATGLLNVHMLSSIQCQNCCRGVPVIRRCNKHSINRLIVQNFAKIS